MRSSSASPPGPGLTSSVSSSVRAPVQQVPRERRRPVLADLLALGSSHLDRPRHLRPAHLRVLQPQRRPGPRSHPRHPRVPPRPQTLIRPIPIRAPGLVRPPDPRAPALRSRLTLGPAPATAHRLPRPPPARPHFHGSRPASHLAPAILHVGPALLAPPWRRRVKSHCYLWPYPPHSSLCDPSTADFVGRIRASGRKKGVGAHRILPGARIFPDLSGSELASLRGGNW